LSEAGASKLRLLNCDAPDFIKSYIHKRFPLMPARPDSAYSFPTAAWTRSPHAQEMGGQASPCPDGQHLNLNQKGTKMNTARFVGASLLTASLLGAVGCTVMREQSTVGQAVDDTAITTKVKARFAESPVVSAMAINVETFHGTVQLSGFAKSETERTTAESIARQVPNVKSVRNDIIVRP